MRDPRIESEFPLLASDPYEVQSPITPRYNCIAWAMGDTQRWWWPLSVGGYYWPKNVRRDLSIDSFVEAFHSEGFAECQNGELEDEFVKVALYARGGREPTHAARQLDGGTWTSKLGQLQDIEHATPDALVGATYGDVCKYFRRRKLAEI